MAMPGDREFGPSDHRSIDHSGPRWMVIVGACMFVIGVACAL
jgi:hypothetical protein